MNIFNETANLPFSFRVLCRSANVDNTTSSSGEEILGFMKHEVSYHAHKLNHWTLLEATRNSHFPSIASS